MSVVHASLATNKTDIRILLRCNNQDSAEKLYALLTRDLNEYGVIHLDVVLPEQSS